MKKIFILTLSIAWGLIPALLFTACGDKDETPSPVAVDPTEGFRKIQDFPIGDYTVSAWNETGEWRLGYTKVYFTVEDKAGNRIDNAVVQSEIEMDMGTVKHGAPHSEITKAEGKALYEAYYAFTMYSGQGDGKWYYSLALTTVDGDEFETENVEIDVKNAFRTDGSTPRRVIQSLTAVDGSEKRYVVTLVEPAKPKVGGNEITATVHERQDAYTYHPVKNFTLKLDPRMPSMENHSSPNNEDLTWDEPAQIYRGKVNFSMTGYWTLNLILQDDRGATIYGNAVTGEKDEQGNPVPSPVIYSSLYFETEF